MNATKTNFLNECISRYNEVKGSWGTVPTQVFAHAFNGYFSEYSKKDERDAMEFVDNLLINNAVYLKNWRRIQYQQDEQHENIYHVTLDRGAHGKTQLKDIDTSKEIKSNIIEIN